MRSNLMKNKKLGIERHFIECDCINSEHLLIFDFCKEWNEIDVYFTDSWRDTFWNRVKNAFKYVFTKDRYYLCNTVAITKDNIKDLEEVIKEMKKMVVK